MAMQISAVHGSHGTVSGQVERVMKEPCASLSLSDEQSEESNVNRQLFCSLCKIAVNSPSQLQEHSRGTKHKTILEAHSGLGPIKAYPRLCFSTSLSHSTPERTFHCEICNVRINSEPQLKQHISSRRHRDAVAGKSNPLTNRHKSLSSAELVATLLFSKDPPKSIGYGHRVAGAAVTSDTSFNQLAFRTVGMSPHVYLPPQFNHALLQPALGTFLSSYRPLTFSPY